jgi:hypothetical protein
MAGLLIFIGIGIIFATIIHAQRKKQNRTAPSQKLRRMRERLDRGESPTAENDDGCPDE